MSKVLVTGGAGYIGSHTCKALSAAGYIPVTYDNLEGGRAEAVKWGPFEEGDIRDKKRLGAAIARHRPEAVIHFAAYAQVEESVSYPDKYYWNNVYGTLNLLDAMRESGLGSIVFSSSAAVYGAADRMPVSEDTPLAPVSPYGHTKCTAEIILESYGAAYGLHWAALRYFNAAGADADGEIGADHSAANRLIPRVVTAGLGTGPILKIFGTDYDTPDGTAVRDFIHVTDLASAHVAALEYLKRGGASAAFNLGSGKGFSVREVVRSAALILGRSIPARICPRRPGDPAVMVANVDKAMACLDWSPVHSSLERIIATSAAWERNRTSAKKKRAGAV